MHALLTRRELSSVGRPVSAASMHLVLAYQGGLFNKKGFLLKCS